MSINVQAAGENDRHAVMEKKRPVSSGIGRASGTARLASFICHDLRHPLTAILAYSELLAEFDLDQVQRQDFHQEIRRAVKRMDDLLSSLMELSKDPVKVRVEVADVVATVKRAIQAVTVRPEFRRVAVRFDHKGLSLGWFDPRGLEQALTNVVLNACEAVSLRTGRIVVRSCGRRDRFEISIADNGPGIPPPIRHAVFLPYVTYGKERGTGLGLAIAQKILRDHGGDIYLRSTCERGTEFRLILPSVPPQGNDSQQLV